MKLQRCYIAALLILLFLALTSCGGGGGDGDIFTGPSDSSDWVTGSTTFTSSDWYNLYVYNAQYSSGYTVRWPGTIPVWAPYTSIQACYSRWTNTTGGRIRFSFYSSEPSNGIQVYLSSDPSLVDANAVATTYWSYYTSTGHIIRATIYIKPEYWSASTWEHTLTHEIGHAIGFFDHTNDGGLMDSTIASEDVITRTVSRVMALLYAYSPHTYTLWYFQQKPTRLPLMKDGIVEMWSGPRVSGPFTVPSVPPGGK